MLPKAISEDWRMPVVCMMMARQILEKFRLEAKFSRAYEFL